MKRDPIRELRYLLSNGVEIKPGDRYPVGFGTDRERLYCIATQEMLDQACPPGAKRAAYKTANPRDPVRS